MPAKLQVNFVPLYLPAMISPGPDPRAFDRLEELPVAFGGLRGRGEARRDGNRQLQTAGRAT